MASGCLNYVKDRASPQGSQLNFLILNVLKMKKGSMRKKISISLFGAALVFSGVFENVKAEGWKAPAAPGKVHRSPQTAISFEELAARIYETIDFGANPLSKAVFIKAYRGYKNLEAAGKLSEDKAILSICDFSLSSREKRLWIIDLHSGEIVFNSLVAHGQGTGEEYATRFSNRVNSHQSSLGFYVTSSTYQGSNGYSMRLLGMDKDFNDKALQRAIVMHGADYVSEAFILANRRIGRSWGCPAVPLNLARPIIDRIKDGTCLYIHHPSETFLQASVWLKKEPVLDHLETIRMQYAWNTAGQPDGTANLSENALAVRHDSMDAATVPIGPQVYQGVRLAGSEGGVQQ